MVTWGLRTRFKGIAKHGMDERSAESKLLHLQSCLERVDVLYIIANLFA